MYLKSNYFFIFLLILFNIHISLSSICSKYYSLHSQSCECEDHTYNNEQSLISLKCINLSIIPNLYINLSYHTIELDSCLNDLNFFNQTFNNLTIKILRIRHCNLLNINEQTFLNIKQLEKFLLENSTILLLKTFNENFQDIFSINSFYKLKSLILKNIRYQQKQKLNFELLLRQLPYLHRLELINIYIDNYRYYDIQAIGQYLQYLSLTNTHQYSLLPIEYLISLERLLIRHLPNIFHTQELIYSLRKLPNLKYILFEHNQLKSINNLQSNTIDDIDLSSNLIETIDEYTFEYVPKLRHLTLTDNPLDYIDQNAFCGIENLQRLSINIKHTQLSPLDNCILINYPYLQIIQDNQIKLQCNCQLMNIFYLQRQDNISINRLFKLNQVCLFKYDNKFIHLHELENYLNCSSFNQCNNLCQDRKIKTSLLTTISSHIQIKSKYTSLSMSLYSFFSHLLFLLLLCFLYL
ncbi:unnamed protein product [Rotaria sordida]|uniref:Leucine rich repeat protein n=2 Tax=Rotaria sordida TaxID=392033 RepID=A0A815CJE6_9BILA|nr:unnamed protein product [Rotaria sordida]CAF1302693.1 unnamed protein product [Rotaria sordida]CAF3769956.1 unnamed protein product [Rotaria sordida]CAF3914998.1 unnamed protein product [Rotaria sordida]